MPDKITHITSPVGAAFPVAPPPIPTSVPAGSAFPTFRFKAVFRNHTDASLLSSSRSFRLQIYRSDRGEWEFLGRTEMLVDGIFETPIMLDPATVVAGSPEQVFISALSSGNLPNFRISLADTPAASGTLAEVTSTYWILYTDPATGDYLVDFGNHFWLDEPIPVKGGSGDFITTELLMAISIPNRDSNFLPAVWGAVHESEKLLRYDPETCTISVVAKGSTTPGGGAGGGGTRGGGGATVPAYPSVPSPIPIGLPPGEERSLSFRFTAIHPRSLSSMSTDYKVQIQIFRSDIPAWENFGSPVHINSSGGIHWDFNYAPATAVFGTLEGYLERGFKTGAMPAMRLVLDGGVAGVTTIASNRFVIQQDPITGVVIVDFLTVFALPTGTFSTMGYDGDTITTESFGTLLKPDVESKYADALRAVAFTPESFAGYNPSDKELLMTVASTPTEIDPDTIEAIILELRAELECLSTQLTLAKSAIEGLTSDVASKSARINDLEAENAVLGSKLLDAQTTIADLEDTIAEHEAASTTVTDVYSKLATEVKSAKEGLVSSGYELTNVNFDLKTFVGLNPDGSLKLNLVDSARSRTAVGEAVSSITFGVAGSTPSVRPAGLTPNVIGLTETMARQRLAQFGLKMKAIYQTTTTGISLGSSFRQAPEAGADAEVGDTITVIFSKGETI